MILQPYINVVYKEWQLYKALNSKISVAKFEISRELFRWLVGLKTLNP
jgi:hypothetical protein